MAEEKHVDWSCACGRLSARVSTGDGSRVVCYCEDCRAFLHHQRKDEWLDASGGSELFQTTPDRIEIVSGADKLAAVRMTSKGPYRWSASCCSTPFANSFVSSQVPFASIQVPGTDAAARKAFGPVRLRYKAEQATRAAPKDRGSLYGQMVAVLRRALTARLSGQWKRNPFFDADGKPVSDVHVLTDEERRAAYGR